ncbi:MAG: hypothetical protein GWP14_03830 [Actinobacteria bacterium]|nr:hypothetical protein [Actinomycetota bacterium]
MAIVAGIDEAGYGPVLGPLLSTATVFAIPNNLIGQDLWKTLSGSVSQGPAKRSGKIAVADSKKLFSRSEGVAVLEKTALCFMHLLGRPTGNLRQLLKSLRSNCAGQMKDYPWYHNKTIALPSAADAVDISICANALRTETQRQGIKFLGVASQVLLVGHYNELVGKTRNKATALAGSTAVFLSELVRRYSDKGLRVHVDKQGGRTRYRPFLQQCFGDWELRIVNEHKDASVYEMNKEKLSWQVHFETKAESKHLPVALASIYAKYVRELFMKLLNRYWTEHVPGLKPTAGYYTDGKRFLSEIGPTCKKLNTPMSKLIRSR